MGGYQITGEQSTRYVGSTPDLVTMSRSVRHTLTAVVASVANLAVAPLCIGAVGN